MEKFGLRRLIVFVDTHGVDSELNVKVPDKYLALLDLVLSWLVYPAAWILLRVRRNEVARLRRCKNALLRVGVFPIRNHYYEPRFDYRQLDRPLSDARALPAVRLNVEGQLAHLSNLRFAADLQRFPESPPESGGFYFDNPMFGRGDADYWYQTIRFFKPKRIYEIGSGFSTLMARHAIADVQTANPDYRCEHVCVEPFEATWLEKSGVHVIRERVEKLGVTKFSELRPKDVLFIDSSHIIRPEGDVLFEYLELLPSIASGVIVHIHDIFTPRNYPREWVEDKVLFWNEQYLLEALLSFTDRWEILGALNYLFHDHREQLVSVCPMIRDNSTPCSIYLRKI